MFILIGSDGKEYGPATADQVKQWIADGRATLETLGKRVGDGAWRRLMEFSEFQRPAPISDMPPPKLPEGARVRAQPGQSQLHPPQVLQGRAGVIWAAVQARPPEVHPGSVMGLPPPPPRWWSRSRSTRAPMPPS